MALIDEDTFDFDGQPFPTYSTPTCKHPNAEPLTWGNCAHNVPKSDLRSFDQLDFVDTLSEETAAASVESVLSGNDTSTTPPAAAPRARSAKRMLKDDKPVGKNGGVYFKRQSNGRLVTHVVHPKIVKNDIRRGYGTIVRNVLNSQDINLIQRFLRDFCTPGTSFHHYFPESAPVLGSRELSVVGSSAMHAMWSKLVLTTPDIAISMEDGQLRVRSDGTSTMHLPFSIAGSNIISDELHEEGVRLVARDGALQTQSLEQQQADAGCMLTLVSNHRFVLGFNERLNMQPSSSPRKWLMPFSASGMFVISMDDCDRIVSLSIEVDRVL